MRHLYRKEAKCQVAGDKADNGGAGGRAQISRASYETQDEHVGSSPSVFGSWLMSHCGILAHLTIPLFERPFLFIRAVSAPFDHPRKEPRIGNECILGCL